MHEAINDLTTLHAQLDAALTAGDVGEVFNLVQAREALLLVLSEVWQATDEAERSRYQVALQALQRQEGDLLRRSVQQRDALQAQLAARAHRPGPAAHPTVANLLDRQA